MTDTRPDAYHHGHLPDALRAATAELVAEKGPAGFSLREVARRAGVSHAAPAHHFGDARGLLTSLAAEGFHRLAEALEAAGDAGSDPRERLARCGQAYVATAMGYPGHFGVILRDDMVDGDDEACRAAGQRAYAALERTVETIRDRYNPDLDVGLAAALCWSAMQGLVELAPKLSNGKQSAVGGNQSLEELVVGFTDLMIDGFRAR